MASSSKDKADMSFIDYLYSLHVEFEEIVIDTNNFADENFITQGNSFKVYKGKSFCSDQSRETINTVVRIGLQKRLADNELVILKNLNHENIVSVLKLSYTPDEEGVIVIKHEANESLNKHLSAPTLTWMQRLHICVGVARALTYLHFDAEEDHCIIHGNIKSCKVLLDDKWEPKLNGFAFAVRAKKHQLHPTDVYYGSLQYMDPAYEKTGGLSHKSDVFSFGVLLFEVLFGTEAFVQNDDNWYFAELARSRYENGKLDESIDTNLRKQMNLESLKIFAKTAYCCLKEERSERLNMNQVLLRLERALELQHKHEHSIAEGEGTVSNYLKEEKLDKLRFRWSDIELATKKFSETCFIGSGGFAKVYKAKLVHFNGINSLVAEGMIKGELFETVRTVAIKRIFNRADTQGEQGFVGEIEMLSNCKHPNIVSLLGFCDEGPEMILVYEHVSNGSLDDYLENMNNFTWAQRIQICLDIANGLNYLHTSTKDKPRIIHRDIKSANILLGENLVAKIADFGLSKLQRINEQGSTLVMNTIAGTRVYLDPEYERTGRLKTKSDIYSFGVVMFEIMCGKLAYDKTYNEMGLPSIARESFKSGTLKKLVDSRLKETDEVISMLNGGLNQDSFDTFSNIAYQCLAESQSERPTMEVIIKELQKALTFQENNKDMLHISLEALKSSTQNFSDRNFIGEGRYWKLYKGVFVHASGCTTIIAKRWNSESRQSHTQFFTELEILKFKHENIIGLVGCCNQKNEKIIVYEYASNERLDKHLDNPSLTWVKRLKICIDIANGLLYLHSGGGELKDSFIHRDIKSGNILLDDYWNAKISNLELSQKVKVYDTADDDDDDALGSLGYIDPEYQHTGRSMTKESDIYSLGVILVEILCGRLAWKEGCEDHWKLLGPLTVRHYNEKRNLDKMIFECIKEQIAPQSLNTFQSIAIECLRDTKHWRPTTSVIVNKLKDALKFQEAYEIWEQRVVTDYKQIVHSHGLEIYDYITKKDLLKMNSMGIFRDDDGVKSCKESHHISLEVIKSGTQNFNDCKVIGEGKFWKLYEGELELANGRTAIVAKRWDVKFHQRHIQFFTELDSLQILQKYNHKNIIGLVGYCTEMNEKIIVYEHASNGSLDKHLDDPSLTWMKRLKICIHIASGLDFLHYGGVEPEFLFKHRDIKSGSILLDGDWSAKISNLESSRKTKIVDRARHKDDDAYSLLRDDDPDTESDGHIRERLDIYSLGVVLLEMLSGRLVGKEREACEDESQSLVSLALRDYVSKGNLDEMVFDDIKEQIAPQPLDTFSSIVFHCLMGQTPRRAGVVKQLKEVLKSQEDYDLWEPKLPIDYKELISQMSNTSAFYRPPELKKDLYDMFSKGILLQDSKVLFSLACNGGRNEMISATRFSYKNPLLRKWLSIPESRFPKVAEIFDVSDLKIQIKIRTQYLSPCVYYKVYLVFRFRHPRESQAKRMYVNLKYKMWNENLHSYFATRREDGWMMIELFQFLNHKEDIDFKVLLQSFSRSYCGYDSIYIEGIQFQAFDNVKREDIETQQKTDKLMLSSSNMKLNKDEIISAEKVVFQSSNVAIQSRFSDAIELPRQHVLHIKCKINSEMLSSNAENVCYLVFKLSDQCCGLHGPVIVRDLSHRRSKETGVIHFRYPYPWNVHDTDWVPEKREDGWKEVIVWKFNSNYELRNDHLVVNLKLVTYEGTMSGLIVRGIYFRPN